MSQKRFEVPENAIVGKESHFKSMPLNLHPASKVACDQKDQDVYFKV